MAEQGSTGNIIAAICNIFFAGLGQLVQGRIGAALVFAIVVYGGYALWFLVIPPVIGAIFHIWSIIDAAQFRKITLYRDW